MPIYGSLDQARRIADKAQSRAADADDLRSGQVSPADLARRNGAFSAVNLRGARIAAIGAREVAAVRARGV